TPPGPRGPAITWSLGSLGPPGAEITRVARPADLHNFSRRIEGALHCGRSGSDRETERERAPGRSVLCGGSGSRERLTALDESHSPVDTLTGGNWEHLTRSTEEYLSRLRNRNEESTEFFTLTSGEQLAITPSSVAFFNLCEDSLEHQILGLLSPQDDKTVAAVYLGAGWCSLDEALMTSDNGRQELVQVRSVGERIVLYLLNRMICGYRERLPDVLPFRPHPINEFAKIFWKDQEAAGFYTMKLKGSLCCASTSQCYQLPVLDTVFVRKKHRRLGLGLRMLSDFCSQFPANQDLGISRPISPAMYRVCHRYLQARPEEQDRLWEVESPGGWSQRENVWLLIQMGDIPSVDDPAQSRSL
ncbi:protein FAM169B, partial [Mobula birostris]|uniref:protein FAM169B n=1 Tax=Mobula birostris TaxID=1983395 RepID=UPI003B281EFA